MSHGLFLKELHEVLRAKAGSGCEKFPAVGTPIPNTAVTRYTLHYSQDGETVAAAECRLFACDKHLN